jgi:hypothetical protein
MHFKALSMDAISMRLRGGCSTVVPMPADVLFSCIAMLIWVRLEARPFHIPPLFALAGWFLGFDVGCGDELCIGEGRCAIPRVTHFEDVSMDAVSMRSRGGCSTVVPMPADVLFLVS